MSERTKGERTRAAVIRAARERFAHEDFGGATVASIAADAGVSEATVSFHFGSKAGLLVAVIDDYYADLVRALEDVIVDEAVPEDRLRSFAQWWLAHTDANRDLLGVFGRQGRRYQAGDEVVAAFLAANRQVTRVFDRLVQDLRHVGVLRTDMPARIVRDAFFGTAEHVMLGRALTGRPENLETAAGDLVDFLLAGAGVRQSPTPEGEERLARIEAKLDQALAT